MARRTIAADVKVAVIAAALEQGPKHFEAIAKQFGVSVPTIYNWKNAAAKAAVPVVETPAVVA